MKKKHFFFFFPPSVIWVNQPFTHTVAVMITTSRGLGCSLLFFFFSFPSATLNKPVGWMESLLCVSMQRRLIMDHSADTFHPGDFMDSTGNILNPTGPYHLHRRPWRSQPVSSALSALSGKGESPVPFFFFFFFLFPNFDWREYANDNLIVLTFAEMLNTDVRH